MFDARKKMMKDSIKKYQNKTFDNSKYVKDFYLEDGKAYITCFVKNYEDLFNSYSYPDNDWLNTELASYLESNAYYIPLGYPIVIKFCGSSFTSLEQAHINKVIKDYFGLKLGDKQIDLRNNSYKAFFLLIMGLFSFLLTYFLLELKIISTFSEWLVILFWFFIWEGASVLFLDRSKLKLEKLKAAQLSSVEVIFEEKNKKN